MVLLLPPFGGGDRMTTSPEYAGQQHQEEGHHAGLEHGELHRTGDAGAETCSRRNGSSASEPRKTGHLRPANRGRLPSAKGSRRVQGPASSAGAARKNRKRRG